MLKAKHIVLLLCTFLFACSNQNNKNAITGTPTTTDTNKSQPPLNPSLFSVRNMKNSDLIKVLPRNTFDYLDSAKKTAYTLFDSIQVARYVQPVFPDYGVWFFAQTKLLSWQDKIGDLQPFIVRIDGQDYNGLVYIVLNKYNIPVSKFELTGGPYDVDADSTYIMHTYLHSVIKNNEIYSYKLYMYMWAGDSIKKPYNIDSILYKSVIQPDGSIVTTRIDSIRYSRMECPMF
jgi:hypothetical protein